LDPKEVPFEQGSASISSRPEILGRQESGPGAGEERFPGELDQDQEEMTMPTRRKNTGGSGTTPSVSPCDDSGRRD
jgi:hypothetical protein